MKSYYYIARQLLPIDIDRAWAFFSTPGNLALITPPWLDLRMQVNPGSDVEIYQGMVIDYHVKPLFGIRVPWKSEICRINRPFEFTDCQIHGPYRLWEHTHRFAEAASGVWMTDEVRYILPFGWIGRMVHALFVRKRLEKIFVYRRQVLQKLFVNYEPGFD